MQSSNKNGTDSEITSWVAYLPVNLLFWKTLTLGKVCVFCEDISSAPSINVISWTSNCFTPFQRKQDLGDLCSTQRQTQLPSSVFRTISNPIFRSEACSHLIVSWTIARVFTVRMLICPIWEPSLINIPDCMTRLSNEENVKHKNQTIFPWVPKSTLGQRRPKAFLVCHSKATWTCSIQVYSLEEEFLPFLFPFLFSFSFFLSSGSEEKTWSKSKGLNAICWQGSYGPQV